MRVAAAVEGPAVPTALRGVRRAQVDISGETELVQPGRAVVADPRCQQLSLPGACRGFVAFKPGDGLTHALLAAEPALRREVLPAQEEAQ